MSADKDCVSLTIPAHAELIGLARLALSAVCRQTRLAPDEVADLKLALTEAAGAFVTDRPGAFDGTAGRVWFEFAAEPERLVIDVAGSEQRLVADEERELSRPILEATVDECSPSPGQVRLVKYLDRRGE